MALRSWRSTDVLRAWTAAKSVSFLESASLDHDSASAKRNWYSDLTDITMIRLLKSDPKGPANPHKDPAVLQCHSGRSDNSSPTRLIIATCWLTLRSIRAELPERSPTMTVSGNWSNRGISSLFIPSRSRLKDHPKRRSLLRER